MTTFEYGAMSSRYSLKADSKLTAYAAMIAHFGRMAHLIAIYEPKEVVKDDQWINPLGKIAARLDGIFGGEGAFDKYVDEHLIEIRTALDSIEQLC